MKKGISKKVKCLQCGKLTKNKKFCSLECRRKFQKRGRTPSINEEVERELIELMADGMTQNEACEAVGISKHTIIAYKKEFTDFSDRLRKAKLATTKLAHKSLKMGMIKDWKAGAWWLERTNPERFREKKEIELKEKPVLIDDLMGDINDEEE